jgi:pimeloyl-ACP methyl ester carboxylesterase
LPEILSLLFSVVTAAGVITGVAAQSVATPVLRTGDFAGLVNIGGRELYLKCRGSGSPTVILEAGFRTRADVWSADLVQPDAPRTMVFPGVAAFTRVCAYDRPGTATVLDGELLPSRSDPVPMPRTAAEAVSDLHALLTSAGIPGPYVLAGHSFGGLFVRLYASTYPDKVAGLVLVDAFPESMSERVNPEQWSAYEDLFQPVPPELADYPALEFTNLDASLDQLRQAAAVTPLRPIPLIVLSRGQAMTMPAELPGGLTGDMLERAWSAGQSELASLLPDARHIIARESEHYIQLQQPELVIDAIRAVVDAARDPATWSIEGAQWAQAIAKGTDELLRRAVRLMPI